MPASAPTIVATSMGSFASRGRGPYDWKPAPVFDLMVELAGQPERPRLCYLGTATGDDPVRLGRGLRRLRRQPACEVSHLSLFTMPTVEDMRAHLLEQDLVWVGGGSVANLLAVWRVHGLDEIFREVWEAGVVLGGVSAGSLCWHVGGTTDSFGPDLRPVTNGLGFIPTSNGVHYDSEEQRRPLYHQLVADGDAARRARHRRRRRAGLPRHRAGRRRGRPRRRRRVPGGTRPRRHRRRDPPGAAPPRPTGGIGWCP